MLWYSCMFGVSGGMKVCGVFLDVSIAIVSLKAFMIVDSLSYQLVALPQLVAPQLCVPNRRGLFDFSHKLDQ